jgi:RimJ/RimL family protein N-acetyltransferase
MIIETKRLILREYTMEDFNDLYEILSCPITMSHYIKPYDENGTKRWIDWCINSYKTYGFGLWAIVLKDSNKFIGDCGLSMQNIDGELLPEIGYHINKNYWRQGYAKEAAEAVKEWAFKNTQFNTLYSYMTKDNVGSYKTAESIGMKRIKEYKDDQEELLVYSINK